MNKNNIKTYYTIFTVLVMIILSPLFNIIYDLHFVSIFDNFTSHIIQKKNNNVMVIDEFYSDHELKQTDLKVNDTIIAVNDNFTFFNKQNSRREIFESFKKYSEFDNNLINSFTLLRNNVIKKVQINQERNLLMPFNHLFNWRYLIIAIFLMLSLTLVYSATHKLESKISYYTNHAFACILIFGNIESATNFQLAVIKSSIGNLMILLLGVGTIHFFSTFPRKIISDTVQKGLYVLYVYCFALIALFYYLHISLSVYIDKIYIFVQINFLLFIVLALTLYIIHFIKEKDKLNRSKLNIILIGLLLGLLPAIIFLVIPSLINWHATQSKEIFFLTIFIPLSYTFAIIKDQLFDVNSLLRKTVMYVLLSALIFIFYVILISLLSFLFSSQFSYTFYWINVISTILLILVLNPIKTSLDKFIKKRFDKNVFDYKKSIIEFTKRATSIISLTELLEALIVEFNNSMKVTKCGIYLEYLESFALNECIGYGNEELNRFVKIDKDENFINLLKANEIVIVDNFANSMPLLAEFKSFNIEIIIPLKVQDDIKGFICLGQKQYEIAYNNDDFDLLLTLSNQFAISISNAIAYNKIKEINFSLEDKVRERTLELNHKNDKLESMNKIVKSINVEVTFEGFLHRVLEESQIIKNVEKSIVLTYNYEKELFEFDAAWNDNINNYKSITLTTEEAIARYLDDSEKVEDDIYIVRNMNDRPHNNKFKKFINPKSLLVICLRDNKDNITAFLIFANGRSEHAFENNDFVLLKNLKEHINSLFIKTNLLQELETTIGNLKDTQGQLVHAEKMTALGHMIAGIAHEMNTPLAYVKNNLELFNIKITQLNEEHGLNPAFFHILEDTTIGINRLIELVKGLKNFSRLDNVNDRVTFNVKTCIDDALLICGNLIRQNQVEITKDLTEVPDIFGNPSQINQVLLNILTNACEAMAEFNKNVPSHLKISLYSDQKFIYLKFSDNGGGIPLHIRDKIFNPFFTTKKIGQGTGLGLSISYKIIKEHKGNIELSVREKQGSDFLISLPII